jgi:hypothetical protein
MAYHLALDMAENHQIIFDNYLWIMFFLITAGERKYRHLDWRASGVIDQMFNRFYENAFGTAMKIGKWKKENMDFIQDKNIELTIASYPSYLKIYWKDMEKIRKMDIQVGEYAFKKIFFCCGNNSFNREERIINTLIAARRLLQVAGNEIDIICEHFEEYREEYKKIPAGQKLDAHI